MKQLGEYLMIRLTIMAVMALLGTAAFADDGRFNLNSEGANGIDEPLRFTAGDVAAAFPSLRVTEFEGDNTFGGGSRMMALLDGDTPVFIIDLAELERVYSFSIFTRSNLVTGPNGWRVGETVLADVVGLSEWECGRGYNEQAHRVSCMNWDENLRLLFENQPEISTDTVGPEAYNAVLGGAVLDEIRLYLDRPIQ